MNHLGSTILSRSTRRRVATLVIAGACIFLVTLVSPALGVRDLFFGGKEVRSLTAGSPPAENVLAVSVRAGKVVTLLRQPTNTGGECVLLHVSSGALGAPPVEANGGGSCTTTERPGQPAKPMEISASWLRLAGEVTGLIDGRTSTTAGITRVELETADNVVPLVLQRGYFLGELPKSSVAGMGPLNSGPLAVVAYDGSGHEVAREDLHRLMASASPK